MGFISTGFHSSSNSRKNLDIIICDISIWCDCNYQETMYSHNSRSRGGMSITFVERNAIGMQTLYGYYQSMRLDKEKFSERE